MTLSNSATNSNRKPHTTLKSPFALFSILIFLVGFALLVMKIVVDSEPGAIPLMLVLIGAISFFLNRYRSRKSSN